MKLFYQRCLLVIATSLSFSASQAQNVKDHLSVPGPLNYNQASYRLSWSAHPTLSYYKQEYLTAGQQADKYTSMLMIEAVTGTVTLKDAVTAKMNEITARKQTYALANYQVIENKATGEYLLDFIMSEGSVVEWNAYRYSALTDKSGKTTGIRLFAISKRSYGNASTAFLKALKTERQKDIAVLAAYKLPEITPIEKQ